MSVARRIAFGTFAAWVARGTSILLGLLLMPVLFRHLQREELGVWLLLGQSWATLGILDLGLGVTLARRIAFAAGKSGADVNAQLTPQSLRAIANLAQTGRRLYLCLAVGAFVLAFGAGFISIRSLHLSSVSLSSAWLAWGVLCLAQAFGVWASVWTCLLQGIGYVGWDALTVAFVSTITLCIQIVVTLLGCGLVGLAAVAAAGALAQRFLILAVARRKRPEVFSLKGSWDPGLVKSMAPLALKAWVTSIALVITTNTDQFFIAGFQGAARIPAYRAAYIVFLNLQMLAVTIASSSSVFVAQLWQAGAVAEVQRIVVRNLRLGLAMMAAGGACVLALGPRLFDLWIGHGNYIGAAISSIFFILLFLEAQAYTIATCSRATEDEAFVVSSCVAAVLNISLSWVLGKKYGLIGIALGTLIAQAPTNHWFMCYRGLRRLQMGFWRHVREVLIPASFLFTVTFCVVQILGRMMSSQPDWIVVGTSVTFAGSVLATAIWLLVLSPSARVLVARLPAQLLRASVR
jgi:O-antigen/teichoic acid export membrane protein